MIGFAVASYKENKLGGLISQGIGTSMLQVPNILKKPVIWLPAIITSAFLGPISTTIFKMTNNASGAGMGTSGLVRTTNDLGDNEWARTAYDTFNKNYCFTFYSTSNNCMVYILDIKKKEYNKRWRYEITNREKIRWIIIKLLQCVEKSASYPYTLQ